jgi:hypothetical protein
MYTIYYSTGQITRDSDGKVIRPTSDFTSQDYINYAEWAITNTPTVAIESVLSVSDVTPRQIRLALLSVGMTEIMIDSVINTLPSPTKEAAMITWKYSTSFQRNNALVPVIGAMLSYNSDQLDQLWITALGL